MNLVIAIQVNKNMVGMGIAYTYLGIHVIIRGPRKGSNNSDYLYTNSQLMSREMQRAG